MKRELAEFFNTISVEWGFAGARDYILTVTGLKGSWNSLLPQIFIALGVTVYTFIEQWVWNPPIAYFLLVFVIFMDAWYGYQVAAKMKGEKFSFRKGNRTLAVLVAHTLELVFFFNIVTRVYPLAHFIAQGVFIYLLSYKTKSWLTHLAMLKLQDGGLLNFVLTLIKSKYGNELVDTIQKQEPKLTTAKLAEKLAENDCVEPEKPKEEKENLNV